MDDNKEVPRSGRGHQANSGEACGTSALPLKAEMEVAVMPCSARSVRQLAWPGPPLGS
jgi:hypothetical protein